MSGAYTWPSTHGSILIFQILLLLKKYIFFSNITLIEELCSKLSKRVCTPVANGLSFF